MKVAYLLVLIAGSAVACLPTPLRATSAEVSEGTRLRSDESCVSRVAAREASFDWSIVSSNGGSYKLALRPHPTPIPVNAPFTLEIEVWDVSAGALRGEGEVRLLVDARMPSHGHGMTLQPEVTDFENCAFVVEGLMFHMRGSWQLLVDVNAQGVTERAQIDLELH